MTSILKIPLIKRTAKRAAEWWSERLLQGDRQAFRESLEISIVRMLRKNKYAHIEFDYYPDATLFEALQVAGVGERDALPRKHDLTIKPGSIKPKEGYGNWTDEIIVT